MKQSGVHLQGRGKGTVGSSALWTTGWDLDWERKTETEEERETYGEGRQRKMEGGKARGRDTGNMSLSQVLHEDVRECSYSTSTILMSSLWSSYAENHLHPEQNQPCGIRLFFDWTCFYNPELIR